MKFVPESSEVSAARIVADCLANYRATQCLLDELLEFARIPPSMNEIEFNPACGAAQLTQHSMMRSLTSRTRGAQRSPVA